MSWLFSRALVEEYSAASCWDGEQSAPLSGSPIPQAYCALDKMTAFSRLSRFGMTFAALMESRGEELLTSYLADFHARTSALQGKAQALTESAAECGEKWHGSFTKYNPDTSSWKTHQCSLAGDLDEFSETWPQWGLMRNGECWEQQTLVQTIRGTESGLWRTPQAQEGMRGVYKSKEAMDAHLNRGHQLSLSNQVAHRHLWPTPTASQMPCEGTQRIMRKKWLAGELSLEEASAIAKRDVRKAQGKVPIWPSPKTRDWKDGKTEGTFNRQSPDLGKVVGQSKTTGALNPDWVEWLMNWPITWSSLNAVNRKEFQLWQEASAAALQESGQLRTMWWDRDPSQAPSGQRSDEQPEQERGSSMQQMPRSAACRPEVEGSHEGSELPLLRNDLHLQARQGEDVQQGVREQTGLDEAQTVPRVADGVTARVDRLKAIGNGQVPLCAATAWRLLNGH